MLLLLSTQIALGDSGVNQMHVNGTFEITMEPQADEQAPVGRIIITKQYSGPVSGAGVGQMISKRQDNGVAIYFAIEEFSGSVDGKVGGFTLVHKGFMNANRQTLEIEILEGSGTGELKTISGALDITQTNGQHEYQLNYEL